MALEALREVYVQEGFDVVLDDEDSGLDMSVVVGDGDCSVISSCLRSKQHSQDHNILIINIKYNSAILS